MELDWNQIRNNFPNDTRRQCKEYFELRYRRSCHDRHIKPFELPDLTEDLIKSDDIFPLLLNDDQFFSAAYCHINERQRLKLHLWDALGTEPDVLDRLLKSMHHWLRQEFLNNWDIECSHIEDVPNKLEQMAVENPDWYDAYSIAASRLRRRLNEHNFTGTSTVFPFFIGMSAYLEDRQQVSHTLFQEILLYTSKQLPRIPESHIATSSEGLEQTLDDSTSRNDLGIFYIYFDVAGAGKTAQVFKLLSQKWGVYAISPDVSVEDPRTATESNEDQVLEARRSSCSRDTFTLHCDVDSITQALGHWHHWWQSVNALVKELVSTRCELLEMFRGLRDDSVGETTPLRWLQLQVSCISRERDPFDMAYRLRRLFLLSGRCNTSYLAAMPSDLDLDSSSVDIILEPSQSQRQQQPDVGERYFCIDEMQTALNSETSRNVLGALLQTLRDISDDAVWENNWLFPITYKHVILSGTALDKKKMELFFQENRAFDPIPGTLGENLVFQLTKTEEWPLQPPRPGLSLSTITQMPSISGSKQFWSFYETHLSCIVAELWAHWNINPSARVNQIPLLARSGRALPFDMDLPEPPNSFENWDSIKSACLQSLMTDVWLFRPLRAASELRTLNFITRWILFYCGDQQSACEVVERLQSEHGLTQENNSLQGFDLLDHPMHTDDIRLRFVNDVNVLTPFLRLISGLFQERQTTFLRALATRLYNGHAGEELVFGNELLGLKDRCMWYIVNHYAKPFRGRYRWSAYFIEELMNETFRHQGFISEIGQVRQVSHNAYETVRSRVCNALEQRLSQLAADPQHQELVSHLIKMAWRAYLLRVPSICKNEQAVVLVREGFAHTTQTSQGAILDESLAVHAVMDFLRHNPRYYENEIHDEMNSSQFDREKRTLTGKMHELSIAMTFDQLLRPSEDHYTMESQNDYDTRKERSQDLFGILSRAVAYGESGSDSAPLFKTSVEARGYQLREGGEVMEYTTTGNIWDWLRDRNRSTFLFPDNNAHPDLMFILERREGNNNARYGLGTDSIICALQSKLGEIHSYSAEISHLRPDHWYTTTKQTTPAAELQEFADLKFLLILAGAGGESKHQTFDQRVKGQGKQKSGNFYFCYMSPDDVRRIFTERYERFLQQLRGSLQVNML